ncbi:MAG TPA: cytochrome c oxidase subunit II [Chthonomonadaceae bacterium]|nr:cytochrome c oxidase subunit II [Chthonomonadaceae bacterium]
MTRKLKTEAPSRVTSFPLTRRAGGLGSLALLLACTKAKAQEQGFPLGPPQASSISTRVDAIFYTELTLALIIAFSVCFLVVFFCFKYRHGSRANRSNPPSRNAKLEVAWIGIPVLLALIFFAWAARTYFDMYNPPPGAIDIYVTAKQWMWKLQHPEGQREIDALHIPVGRPVRLIMTSQDVIHSFFVPAFRIKQDVLPGRETTTWFEATQAGKYHLFCAQYCGLNHSRMTGWIYAMEPADYERWLSQTQGEPTLAAQGERLYEQLGCSGCHGASNTVRAPTLEGLYGKPVPLSNGQVVIADDRYLHDSILLPKLQVVAGYKPVMPSFKGAISDDQVMELVAYIKSLGNNAGRADPRLPQNAVGAGAETTYQQQSVKARIK